MNAFETYIRDLQEIRATGAAVKETSYYGALEKLLNELGKALKPQVRCVMQLKNIGGAGMPDGGLFTASQFQRKSPDAPTNPTNPERGVIEIKGTGDDAWVVAETKQVSKYWDKYRQVLVTNYRDFVLIGQDTNGQPITLETYRLAKNEAEFWEKAKNPRQFAQEQEEQFTEYLKRVMLQSASIATPKDLAWFLASYAKDAKARIEKTDIPALETLRKALEEALGITFTGDRKDPKKGERFFKSTLIQTLFYGIFSAWVLWHKKRESGRFDWRVAGYYLHVPMIKALFEKVATPTHVRRLDLEEVLNWTGEALNRVDRTSFFSKFDEGQAVQYFYEPFLEAFDPELRKELGVWYTPPEIVQYMVARVDTVLREELQIEDGLADPNVYILDPCCGTGAYLVEVLRRIDANLQDKGMGALVGSQLKAAAMNRVFGFEILTAPFVVAHLQLGLLLQNLGVPLSDEQERVGVYLTNALTGWEPPKQPKQLLLFPELEEERDAADKVKQERPILVVLGNPPYNGFAGVAIGEERDLSNAYRSTKKAPKPEGQGLNELYMRFFRMAERRIIEQTGRGVVCFISNYSWLEGLSFTGMRERYVEAFNSIWIDNLHGDRIISEYAPDGRTSETVFAMQGTSVGIKVGTTIALLISKDSKESIDECKILYRDMHQARASDRRQALLQSIANFNLKENYKALAPIVDIGFPLKPIVVNPDYLTWITLPEIFPVSFPGVTTSRDPLVVDIEREQLIKRIQKYFDPKISHDEMRNIAPCSMKDTQRFQAIHIREKLQRRGFITQNIIRYSYRPFDIRWLYWEPETKLLDEKRTEYFPHILEENIWLGAAQHNRRDFDPPFVTRRLSSYHIIERGANFFPLKDFALDANWGYAVQNGIQPGKGKVIDRPYTSEEQTALAQVIEQLGTATHDIYLNNIAYWQNIPDRVWNYTIGGYQVIKKWLSYRDQKLLRRSLKQEEVIEVTQMARRIAAILLLEPELDANYEAVKQATYPWSVQKL